MFLLIFFLLKIVGNLDSYPCPYSEYGSGSSNTNEYAALLMAPLQILQIATDLDFENFENM